MVITPPSNILTLISLVIFLVALMLVVLFIAILCCGYCCCKKAADNSNTIQSPPKKAVRRNRFVLIGDCLWHKNHATNVNNNPINSFVTASATSSQSSNSSRLPLYAEGVNHSLTSEYDMYSVNENNKKQQQQWQKNLVGEKLRNSYPLQSSLDNSSDYYSSILLLSSAGSGNYLPQQPTSPHPLPPPYAYEHCQYACAPYLMQRSSSGIETSSSRNIRPPSFTAPPPPPSVPPPFYNSRNLSSSIQPQNFQPLRSSPTIL